MITTVLSTSISATFPPVHPRRAGWPQADRPSHPQTFTTATGSTLDQLSDGRLTLGVGLGSDRFGGELSKTGEQLDDRQRGRMLDESLAILAAAWSGEPVRHRGEHHTVDDITFLPRPVQRPGVPVWAAGFPGNVKPIRRAARLDGFEAVQGRPDG
ncbi:LLM class flavin-dependent oxidoreductase [Nonomuraea angiospora]|uniref:LLM class flavin-dependent oxidoreductase n=1 Tax=Nonomuraea angiospora TaxID=46172 RepID=UPI003327386B